MKMRSKAKDNFSIWSSSIKQSIVSKRGDNLLDHHFEPQMSWVIPKQDYDRWCGKFFHLENMFTATCILTSLEMHRRDQWRR